MAYCNMLVDTGLFERVEINFLPVGHTHCDVDQLFSRISVILYGSYCMTFAELLEVKFCKLNATYSEMLSSYAMRFKFGFRNAKPPAAK
jgi:hypothetical protein